MKKIVVTISGTKIQLLAGGEVETITLFKNIALDAKRLGRSCGKQVLENLKELIGTTHEWSILSHLWSKTKQKYKNPSSKLPQVIRGQLKIYEELIGAKRRAECKK